MEKRNRYYCMVQGSDKAPKVVHLTEEQARAEAERLSIAYKAPVTLLQVVATVKAKRVYQYVTEWDEE